MTPPEVRREGGGGEEESGDTMLDRIEATYRSGGYGTEDVITLARPYFDYVLSAARRLSDPPTELHLCIDCWRTGERKKLNENGRCAECAVAPSAPHPVATPTDAMRERVDAHQRMMDDLRDGRCATWSGMQCVKPIGHGGFHVYEGPATERSEVPPRSIAVRLAASQRSEATPLVAENVADSCRNVTDDEFTAFMKVVAAEAGDARPWNEIVADDEFAETTRWLRAALDNLLASRSTEGRSQFIHRRDDVTKGETR